MSKTDKDALTEKTRSPDMQGEPPDDATHAAVLNLVGKFTQAFIEVPLQAFLPAFHMHFASFPARLRSLL